VAFEAISFDADLKIVKSQKNHSYVFKLSPEIPNLFPVMQKLHPDRTPAVETRALAKQFGSLTAVDNVSLKVLPGEIFGLLGPNGAGKTTTIRMICGLIRPTSGEVLVQGRPLTRSGSRSMYARVGVCPQENILWSKLTCMEQLVFSARIYGKSRSEALGRAVMLLDRMGLKSKRNRLANTLSGGMKRRMNIIMAMMHDPDILVFDEPEAGLDPQSRVLVREFIRELAERKSVIITTHNMDEAERLSDRVAIMDHGRLLRLDTPENLKKSIGEGDILVIRLNRKDPELPGNAGHRLAGQGLRVDFDGDLLTIRSRELVSQIPEIYRVLEEEGPGISEMKLRTSTLEDVFIQLTGKSLRS
jgi:ABC-2 type transport system ATP-binding protein